MKALDDAKALAAAASGLVTELEQEGDTTVTDKTIDNVVINYTDGTSDTIVAPSTSVVDPVTPAPVVSPVNTEDAGNGNTVTGDTPTNAGDTGSSSATDDGSGTATDTAPDVPVEVPEGATEVQPTVAGTVPTE